MHSSTRVARLEKTAKFTPRGVQVAPKGRGDPACIDFTTRARGTYLSQCARRRPPLGGRESAACELCKSAGRRSVNCSAKFAAASKNRPHRPDPLRIFADAPVARE